MAASAAALLVTAAAAPLAAEAARIRNPFRDKFPSPSSKWCARRPPRPPSAIVRRLESSHERRKGQQLTPRWNGSSVAAPPGTAKVRTTTLVAAAPGSTVMLPAVGASVPVPFLTAASVAE